MNWFRIRGRRAHKRNREKINFSRFSFFTAVAGGHLFFRGLESPPWLRPGFTPRTRGRFSRVDYRQYRFDDGRRGQGGVRLPFVLRGPVPVVRNASDDRVRMTVVAHQGPHDRVEFRIRGQQPVLGGEFLSHELVGHGALTAADGAHVYSRGFSGIKNGMLYVLYTLAEPDLSRRGCKGGPWERCPPESLRKKDTKL